MSPGKRLRKTNQQQKEKHIKEQQKQQQKEKKQSEDREKRMKQRQQQQQQEQQSSRSAGSVRSGKRWRAHEQLEEQRHELEQQEPQEQQQQQQQQQQVSEAVQALDAAVRALAALTSGNQVPQPVFEELLAAGLVKLLKRVLVAPLEAASDSLLGNAALCISHVAARATLLPALCAATQPPTQGGGNKEPRGAPSLEEAQADLVAALLRVAATKGGGTASRNAGIALARMAQNTQMLLRLKELRGLEIIHATARP